jgi:hypothetical protein
MEKMNLEDSRAKYGEDTPMSQFVGLRNIVTSKFDWKYLFLYEIDNHEEHDCLQMIDLVNRFETSYICYKTKAGFHLVGLTPITSKQWGCWFDTIQRILPEYFSGQTLRLTRKIDEIQEMIHYSFRYPYLERLASIYIKRFGIPKEFVPIYGEPPKYNCVYEKYWSIKV